MLIPGLVSVTFRDAEPEKIVAEMRAAGLRSVEWAGDVHVPAGAVSLALVVRQLTEDAGLTVAAYGSYFRLGQRANFAPWLDAAAALGAPTIRIWAGNCGSEQVTLAERAALVAELQLSCTQAEVRGLSVSLEFHEDTLCDSPDSTLQLLHEVAAPNLYSYWQQPALAAGGLMEKCRSLRMVVPHLTHLHVFHRSAPRQWRPLQEGEHEWRSLLSLLDPGRTHAAMLEFVQDDSFASMRNDAAVLISLIDSVQPPL